MFKLSETNGFRFKIKVSIKKMSWGSLIFSLLQCNLQQLFGKCSGRDEKCGKMWKNVLITRFLYTTEITLSTLKTCSRLPSSLLQNFINMKLYSNIDNLDIFCCYFIICIFNYDIRNEGFKKFRYLISGENKLMCKTVQRY